MKRIILCVVAIAAVVAITAIAVVGCDSYTGDSHDNVTNYLRQFDATYDDRDGKAYKTVTIGGKRWMAENLNYDANWCYDNSTDNCAKYGRLYNLETAKTICPSGWHLPSRDEWDHLAASVGWDAGTKLKAKSGWNNNGNGTDSFGFSALPGGYRGSSGGFAYAGNYGYWWTATEYSSGYAYLRRMSYGNGSVYEYSGNNKDDGYSVRCVAD